MLKMAMASEPFLTSKQKQQLPPGVSTSDPLSNAEVLLEDVRLMMNEEFGIKWLWRSKESVYKDVWVWPKGPEIFENSREFSSIRLPCNSEVTSRAEVQNTGGICKLYRLANICYTDVDKATLICRNVEESTAETRLLQSLSVSPMDLGHEYLECSK